MAGGGVGKKITSLPYEITAPGFYYLSGNLNAARVDGITISADDVTLDLMGFQINGTSSSNGISCTDRKNIEVRNGTLRGWNSGFYANGGTSHQLINLRLIGNYNGIATHAFSIIKGCIACDNINEGIFASGQSTISGCHVTNCPSGIVNTNGRIEGNIVRDCSLGGIDGSGIIIILVAKSFFRPPSP